MSVQFETLVLVADGGAARAFEERRRHGPLIERSDWLIENKSHAGRPSQGGTLYERAGGGRHGLREGDPTDAAESRFLEQVAERLDRAAADGLFEKLVVIAPPKALGVLREALKPATARRLELCDPHDRMHESLEDIRIHLHGARAPA